MNKKLVSLAMAAMMMVSLAACGTANSDVTPNPSADAAKTRAYVDMDGTQVQIPDNPQRVVDLWPANNQVLTLLGVADRLVGTTSGAQTLEMMVKINPQIKDLPSLIEGEEVNVEGLLNVQPDLVILNDRGVETARKSGVACVNLHFDDFDGLKEMVKKTAELFGGEAVEKGNAFITYFDGNLKKVGDIAKTIPEKDRKKVYYARNDSGKLLSSDGAKTMAAEWIESIGAINVASSAVEGFNKEISMEHILKEDPDVIVLMDIKDPEKMRAELLNDAKWKGIKAVKNKQVFINPSGVFYWDRYSTEEAMQILWAAKMVYPEYYEELDLVEETQAFYKDFFQYALSEEEANELLNTKLNAEIK